MLFLLFFLLVNECLKLIRCFCLKKESVSLAVFQFLSIDKMTRAFCDTGRPCCPAVLCTYPMHAHEFSQYLLRFFLNFT